MASQTDLGTPHIGVPTDLPGMESLVAFKPGTGRKLMAFVHELLRGPSPLTPGERELIAAFVSTRNGNEFCRKVHSATAARLLGDERPEVGAKMQALLDLAGRAQQSGLAVAAADVERVRSAGATDEEIHDAVLIAAAFSMINRYVDGLAAPTPSVPEVYEQIAGVLAAQGYAPAEPDVSGSRRGL